MLLQTPISFKKRTDEGVRDEHRFENSSFPGVRDVVRSCPSIRAILRCWVDGFERRAETRERPAGPPPTQTRSKISGFFATADALDAVDQKLRRTAGGSSRKRLAVRIELDGRGVSAIVVLCCVSVSMSRYVHSPCK